MRFGFHFLDFTLPGIPQTLAPTIAKTAAVSGDRMAALEPAK